jgi:alginate O-acetyltransferase complex protein AlgI
MVTFLIGGLWHGAGWTFLFWGFLHGCAIVIHRIWKELGFKINKFVGWFITFNFVNIAWVFFRAKEWTDAIKVLQGMLGISGIKLPGILLKKLPFLSQYKIKSDSWLGATGGDYRTILWIFFGFILVLCFKNSMEKVNSFQINYKTALFAGFICAIGIIHLSQISEFIYFNF